jgi:hypothetical protein
MAKIKRFGVIKTACFMGLYGVFMGLIFGIILLIYTQVLKTVLDTTGSDLGMISLLGIGGWLGLILFPLIYGILFFLIGLVFTPLMNLILKMINGLDWDIEMEQQPNSSVITSQNLEYSQGPSRQY